MDDPSLDRLARALADRTSRRGVLGLLGALTGLGVGAGQASRRRPREQGVGAEACRTLTQSCTKKRPGIGRWRKCCSGLVCRNKQCRIKECSGFLGCGEGRGCCDGTCVDLQRDPTNCGACSRRCLTGERCLGGGCVSSCLAGLTNCDGTCVDLLRDPQHCGACNVVCPDGMTCQDGRCHPLCRELGEACSADAACCEQSPRVTCTGISPSKANGQCGPAFLGDRCCTTRGWECRSACDCCGAMACINGTCSSRVPGQDCADSAESLVGTCQLAQPKPDDSCLFPANLPPRQVCCLDEWFECTSSCQCCGTLTCQDGVCNSFGSG